MLTTRMEQGVECTCASVGLCSPCSARAEHRHGPFPDLVRKTPCTGKLLPTSRPPEWPAVGTIDNTESPVLDILLLLFFAVAVAVVVVVVGRWCIYSMPSAKTRGLHFAVFLVFVRVLVCPDFALASICLPFPSVFPLFAGVLWVFSLLRCLGGCAVLVLGGLALACYSCFWCRRSEGARDDCVSASFAPFASVVSLLIASADGRGWGGVMTSLPVSFVPTAFKRTSDDVRHAHHRKSRELRLLNKSKLDRLFCIYCVLR